MHITDQQRALLAGFTCQRLTADKANQQLIHGIIPANDKTDVVGSLRARGWSSDTKGTIAYYVVKNSAGQIVFFFSLRCGLLCETNYVQRIERLLSETVALREALDGAAKGNLLCAAFLENERLRLGDEEFQRRLENLKDLHNSKTDILRDVRENAETLPEEKSVWVDESHSAVELVEMGVNAAAREAWDRSPLGVRKLGTTMFWQFVVPAMQQLCAAAGCEFAYLFAAGTASGGLVRYYRTKLHFIIPVSLGAVKPSYDKNCVLMCKKLFTGHPGVTGPLGLTEKDTDYLGLDRHRDRFFDRFNDPSFD